MADKITVLETAKIWLIFWEFAWRLCSSKRHEEIAEVSFQEDDQFSLCNNITSISFETTQSNTGLIKRVCNRIQREFGPIILWWIWSHHIHEIILKRVLEKCSNLQSSSRYIQIFRKTKSLWTMFNKESNTIDVRWWNSSIISRWTTYGSG